jgi:hypothetical protein
MRRNLESILVLAEGSLRASDLAEQDLWFVEPSWNAGQALEEMDRENIDIAPIREEPVQRYVVRDRLRDIQDQVPLTVAAHAVDVVHLVTGNLGLAEALDLLLERGFLFTIEGGRISGIITPSDTQRVPVSMVVFSLILAAEAGLNELIVALYGSEAAWMAHLSGPRLTQLEGRFDERQRRNAETTRLDLLMLEDRLTLVGKRASIWQALGFKSRGRFDAWAALLRRTRDALAHGGTVLDVEQDPAEALRLIRRVREFATQVWKAVGEVAPVS